MAEPDRIDLVGTTVSTETGANDDLARQARAEFLIKLSQRPVALNWNEIAQKPGVAEFIAWLEWRRLSMRGDGNDA